MNGSSCSRLGRLCVGKGWGVPGWGAKRDEINNKHGQLQTFREQNTQHHPYPGGYTIKAVDKRASSCQSNC